jgi:adenosine 3'-phospho 5'-phosphosulfate transporter B2
MADEAALPVAAAAGRDKDERRRWLSRCALAVVGIMSTLLVYGVLQVRPLPSPRLRLLLPFGSRVPSLSRE